MFNLKFLLKIATFTFHLIQFAWVLICIVKICSCRDNRREPRGSFGLWWFVLGLFQRLSGITSEYRQMIQYRIYIKPNNFHHTVFTDFSNSILRVHIHQIVTTRYPFCRSSHNLCITIVWLEPSWKWMAPTTHWREGCPGLKLHRMEPQTKRGNECSNGLERNDYPSF